MALPRISDMPIDLVHKGTGSQTDFFSKPFAVKDISTPDEPRVANAEILDIGIYEVI